MTIVNSNTWSTRSLNAFNNYYPTPTQLSPFWGSFLLDNGILDQGIYEFDVRFIDRGRQIFNGAADDFAQFYIDGEYIGGFGPANNLNIITTPKYYNQNHVARLTIIRADSGTKPTAVACKWVGNQYNPVEITSFNGNPKFLTNTTSTILSWNVNNSKKLEINQNIGNVTGLTQKTIDTKLQSVVGVNSPATKIYTLTAFGEVEEDIQTATVEISVFNDRTPNNIEIPNFYNREPNEIVTYSLPAIAGIDAPITVSGSAFVTISVGAVDSFTTSVTARNGDFLRIKFPAPDFSQNPETLDNTVEYYIDIGTIRKYFTVTTRAPNDNELFDFGDIANSVPYPAPPGNSESPPEYLVSPDTVEPTAEEWEVELQNPNNTLFTGGVEVKTTHTDKTQIRVKAFGGSWGTWTATEYLYDQIIDSTPRILENMSWSTLGTRTGDINNTQPKNINTRSAGVLIAKNII